MASPLSRHLNAKSLLSLPPAIRASTYTYSHARTFSSTPSRKIDPVGLIVAAPTELLNTLHNTLGIPWSATIPLTAVLVRTTLVYYISTRPSRRRKQIQNHLMPLANAHVRIDPAVVKRRNKPAVPGGGRVSRLDMYVANMQSLSRNMKTLRSAVGLGRARPTWLLNFGVLIAFSEAIRLKCGLKEGLLKMVFSSFQWIWDKFNGAGGGGGGNAVPVPPENIPGPRDSAEAMAGTIMAGREAHEAKMQAAMYSPETREALTDFLSSGNAASTTTAPLAGLNETTSALEPTITEVANLDPSRAAYFDPTMMTEGLSFCPDLTIPDPTFILPVMLFATMAGSVILTPAAAAAGMDNSPDHHKKDAARLAASLTKSDLSNPSPASTSHTPAGLGVEKKGMGDFFGARKRFSIAIVTIFTFAAMKMPAGILLYIIASAGSGWVQQRYLDFKHPIRPGIRPCRRPVRMKIKRMY